MARMLVSLDGRAEAGGAPLLMHNDRLADPLNPFSLEIGKISRKRQKTEADHMEIALLEFMGGMYNDETDKWLAKRPGVAKAVFASSSIGVEVLVPYIPGLQIVRTMQEAAKRHKLGKSVVRGVTPVTLKAPVQYDGPTNIEELWRDGGFALRKSVGIGAARTMRTRPVFEDWSLEVEIEVDLTILDPEKVNQLIFEAGKFEGIGDYRPHYGRFYGTAMLLEESGAKKTKKAALA